MTAGTQSGLPRFASSRPCRKIHLPRL